jgi:hypothetical protein
MYISYQCFVMLHAVMVIMECLSIITITKCCRPTSTEYTWYLVHIVLVVHVCVGFYSQYQFYSKRFVFTTSCCRITQKLFWSNNTSQTKWKPSHNLFYIWITICKCICLTLFIVVKRIQYTYYTFGSVKPFVRQCNSTVKHVLYSR